METNINEILASLPTGFMQLGDDNHAQNTANFSMLVNAHNAIAAGDQTTGDPTKKDVPLAQTDGEKFGNWTGQKDTKIMATDLLKRGLKGADQLVYENQDVSSTDSITKKNKSDWIPSAIQQILQKAYSRNLRTPAEIVNNKTYLLSGLDTGYKSAINSDSFNNIYPNFWNVITDSILPEQYAKFDNSKK